MAEDKPEEIVEESNVTVEPEQPQAPEQPETPEPVAEPEDKEPKKPNRFKKVWIIYKKNKKLSLPLTALVLLLILLILPQTRYTVLGQVMKKDVVVYVLDDKTHSPILGDKSPITIDGKSPSSGNAFPAVFKNVSVGKHRFHLESGYYYSFDDDEIVGIGRSKEKHIQYSLIAPDRGGSITVKNKINGKSVEGIHVKYGTSETVTNKDGIANFIVAANAETVEVELSGKGFNTIKTKITVDSAFFKDYPLEITPAGKVYFLSKLSGKIDVVKTDLDGSNRQTVLAGTGKEEEGNTVLLAARDWKYLALLSRRDSAKAKLYLLDTNGDKLTEIDSGDATFNLAGWSDHNFLYTAARSSVHNWQPKQSALKTYNAESGQLLTIDETNAEGTGDSEYAGESFGTVSIVDGRAIYAKNWYAGYYSVYRLAGKRMSLIGVKANGLEKQTIKDFDAGSNNFIGTALSKPDELYVRTLIADHPSFYEYTGGKLSEDGDMTDENFYKPYPTYLQSPNNQAAFWFESRDGKNALFTGTKNAGIPVQIATLSEYTPYGWYTDDYLLVSKSSSQLYIMSKTGDRDPIKITDYHKPDVSYYGYGGGYGGL